MEVFVKRRYGMKPTIQENRQGHPKADNSQAVAEADAKVLATLDPEDKALVLEVMTNHPGLTAAKALEMLTAAGM